MVVYSVMNGSLQITPPPQKLNDIGSLALPLRRAQQRKPLAELPLTLCPPMLSGARHWKFRVPLRCRA